MVRVVCAGLMLIPPVIAGAAEAPRLRVAITPVLVEHYLEVNRQLVSLVAPLVYDEPVYYSYVIVPRDSPVQPFEELRGKRYAFSDPLSNSGHLVPRYILAEIGELPHGSSGASSSPTVIVLTWRPWPSSSWTGPASTATSTTTWRRRTRP